MDYYLHCHFHNVSADMSSGLLQVFVELENLHGISNYVLYWIHGDRCSDSVSHNLVQVLLACSQDWTCNLQNRYTWCQCKLREPTPITVTPCVLLDNSEWIFGTYKLNVLTWLELLLLCMIFLPVLIFRFFFLI